jgi:hypothetical protein
MRLALRNSCAPRVSGNTIRAISGLFNFRGSLASWACTTLDNGNRCGLKEEPMLEVVDGKIDHGQINFVLPSSLAGCEVHTWLPRI